MSVFSNDLSWSSIDIFAFYFVKSALNWGIYHPLAIKLNKIKAIKKNQVVIIPLTSINAPIPIIHVNNKIYNAWRILFYGFLHYFKNKITSQTKKEVSSSIWSTYCDNYDFSYFLN